MDLIKTTISSQTFKLAISAISEFVVDAGLKFKPDGLFCNLVDDANVCMLSTSIPSSCFKEFDVDDETPFGIDVKKLSQLLKNFGDNEDLNVELNKTKSQLKIKSKGLAYGLSLLNLDILKREPKVPTVEFPFRSTMDSTLFRRAIKAAEGISDFVIFEGTEEGLKISSKEETTDFEMKIPKEDLESVYAEESANSMFSIEYLNSIVRSLSGSKQVVLELQNEMPCRITADLDNKKGLLQFLLAPSVFVD